MPHINTGPGQHDPTVSAFIIRLDKEPRIILHIHKYTGTYLHFGGHIERDEDPWQCLVRETKEESGYDISQLKILQPKNSLKDLGEANIHPLPFLSVTYHYKELDHFHDDYKYAFVTHEEPKDKPKKGESEAIRSFSRKELLELPDGQIKPRDRELCLYVLDELMSDWRPLDTGLFRS
ncbi:MAG TPA: NUDIX domain-containing protein [Candidatus Saccharimonadales bacterium]|nr:NUDIX domain-containing protein [Candidatus Saccharimonadales bacterium]